MYQLKCWTVENNTAGIPISVDLKSGPSISDLRTFEISFILDLQPIKLTLFYVNQGDHWFETWKSPEPTTHESKFEKSRSNSYILSKI